MSLEKRDRPSAPQWITVFLTHNVLEAHVVLGKLQSEGIPALLHQEAGAAAIGITLGNLGEVKILVAPGDLRRAKELLHADVPHALETSNDKVQLIFPQEPDSDADTDAP